MAEWDWDWKAGPRGGTLVDLDTLCKPNFPRIVDFGSPGSHGGNVPLQYRHGAGEVAHLFSQENLIPLEISVVGLAQLTDMKKLLYGGRSMVTLQMTAPDWGTVQIDGKIFQPVFSSQDRFTFLVPFLAPDPFWRSTTLNTQNPVPNITVGGNAPVDDAEFTYPAGDTDPILTHTPSGETFQILGAVPAGGVVFYARYNWVERVTGGADWGEFFIPSGILELDADTVNAFTYSGAGAGSLSWRNKFR